MKYLAHNPTGELIKAVTRELKYKKLKNERANKKTGRKVSE